MKQANYKTLFEELGIRGVDSAELTRPFIHRSYINETKRAPLESNEKLEFLGDSVLSLATSLYLFKQFPGLSEGIYTDIKASLVRTETLAEVAHAMGLGTYLLLSHGEELNGGRTNKNILADCLESLIGFLFLKSGFENTFNFIDTHLFQERAHTIVSNQLYLSPKSKLQESMQALFRVLPRYTVDLEEGPEHKKHFTVSVWFDQTKIGSGSGESKKVAEEQAAKNALENLSKQGYNY